KPRNRPHTRPQHYPYHIPPSCSPKALTVLAAAPAETVFSVPEEHVERSQRSVAPGDVALQIHLLCAAELAVRVDLLLEDAEPIPDHHHLVEERFQRKLFRLQSRVCRLEHRHAALPFGRERTRSATP